MHQNGRIRTSTGEKNRPEMQAFTVYIWLDTTNTTEDNRPMATFN